jgi:tetratricopeptide (TPR) repeat protein
MKTRIVGTFLLLVGCGGSGPSQAEAPKPNLEDPAPAGASAMAALDAVQAKDYDAAKGKADEILAKSPNDPIAHFALGIVAEERDQDLAAAEKHYRAALAADRKLVGASIYLSALLVQAGRHAEAAEVARKGLEHGKATAELHVNLGYALAGQGDHGGAAKSFGNAIALAPDAPEFRIARGDALFAGGDKDGAIKEYKNALSRAKGAVAVLADVGRGLAQAGDPQGCILAFDQAIAGRGKLAPKDLGLLHLERGRCRAEAKDLAGARADADKGIELSPGPSAHYAAARYAEAAGDKKACKQHFAKVLELAASAPAEARQSLEAKAKAGVERCK